MPPQHYKPTAWDFQCPYKHNCPHLQHLSAQWVWEEYQRSCDEHLDQWKVRDIQQEQLEKALNYIGELEEENQTLRAKLKALHQRQFKANKNSSRQPSENNTDQRCASKKKKRGAPNGHPGWSQRKPDHIDKTVTVPAPTVCPHCACEKLNPVAGLKDHLQEDIIFNPRTHVTHFRHHQAFCPKCRRPVIEAAEDELLNCPIGPTTKAAAVFLRYGLNIPYRKVKELFEVFFNMPLVAASAMAFDRSATLKGAALYEDLKEKLHFQPALHADETFWRQDGINHFLWYAGNNEMALFHIDRHRSSTVARSLLGDNFGGVLHTDGYAAYNAVNPKERQSCLAHLIRKAKEIKQEITLKKPRFQDQAALGFLNRICQLLKKACEIGNKLGSDCRPSDRADALQARLYSALNTICSKKIDDQKAETFRKRLVDPNKEYHRLFTFLKYPDVHSFSLKDLILFVVLTFFSFFEVQSCFEAFFANDF
jgi:hypothetical protein